MKIVDSLAEQARLEELIDASKPPVPPECRHLHYLLFTPFRYGAPYPRGSRFRPAGATPGVFYASKTASTAITEAAFHRLLFFADAPAMPWPDDAGEYTAFAVTYRTPAGLDLAAPPLDRDAEIWTHATDYAPTQALADAARRARVEAIRYPSARDPQGTNLALFACRAFSARAPTARQTWRIHLGSSGIRAVCGHPDVRLEFGREAFARDPRAAACRWDR